MQDALACCARCGMFLFEAWSDHSVNERLGIVTVALIA
jgi:hypothetical protein